MKKALIFVIFAFSALFADDNWNWLRDTLAVTSGFDSAVTVYTTALPLSGSEDIRVVVKADDTSNAGHSGDSIHFEYGYQTGSLCLDTGNNADTCWDDLVILDTFDLDSLGVSQKSYVKTGTSHGTLVKYWNRHADTTHCTGYSYQSRWFVPEWDGLIRFWATGMQNNCACALDLVFDVKRRKWVPVREM